MTSPRPHYHHTLRTESGSVIFGATVELLVPGTDTRDPGPIFLGDDGPAERGSQWLVTDGVVDFYVDAPASYDILVTPMEPGHSPFLLSDQWAGDVENRVGDAPNARGVEAGHVPLADGQGSWGWNPPGDPVDSVNSRTGEVVVDAEDIGAVAIFGAQQARAMTRAEYDALTPKDGQTVYFIKATPVVAPDTLTILRTEVYDGVNGGMVETAEGPGYLGDDSDATYLRISTVNGTTVPGYPTRRWYLSLDGTDFADATGLELRVRFTVNSASDQGTPTPLSLSLEMYDSGVDMDYGDWAGVTLSSGVVETGTTHEWTVTFDQAWMDAYASFDYATRNGWGNYVSGSGATFAELRDALLLGPGAEIATHFRVWSSVNEYEIDLHEVSFAVVRP